MRTIIFLSGFGVPKWLARTRFVWNDPIWKDYRRIYLTSKTPISDNMVGKELDRLSAITQLYPDVAIAGQSLGAWWAANLACHPKSKIKKLILWTPLGNASAYPIFNVTPRYHITQRIPNPKNVGYHRTLLTYAQYDLVVPYQQHTVDLLAKFLPTTYKLNGGHLFQSNHQNGLDFMKEWIELD